jgi:hypothetical protein
LEEALKEYKSDLDWDKRNRQHLVTRPIDVPGIEMQEIKNFYDKRELLNKKRV